tara:strand:- start:384 stop:569 length:186 start_codon:yes stop_codon:yes gene_type:complete
MIKRVERIQHCIDDLRNQAENHLKVDKEALNTILTYVESNLDDIENMFLEVEDYEKDNHRH